MSSASDMLLEAADVLLENHGDILTASTGDSVLCKVEVLPVIPEPGEILQSKSPVFAKVECKWGTIANPRTITRFTESSGRFFKVLKYEEAADHIWHSWVCEVQRS